MLTKAQAKALEVLEQCNGNKAQAAREYGTDERNYRRLVNRALAKTDFSIPAGHDGLDLTGLSTLQEGQLPGEKLRWVIRRKDKRAESREQVIAAFREAAEVFRGSLEPTAPPKVTPTSDLLATYPIGDVHVGMLSWARETGQPYDLKIVRRIMLDTMHDLVQSVPDAEYAHVIILGDFFHSDNMENRTARNRHVLDVDGRWAKVLEVGLTIAKQAIITVLGKHKTVRVAVETGNHDDHSSVYLRIYLREVFANEPRVTIDDVHCWMHSMRFGKNLVLSTHGHTATPARLAQSIPSDYREHWADIKFAHCYVGHIHKLKVHEYPGLTIEYVRVPAARDGYATAGAYRSARQLRCDVWQRSGGMKSQYHQWISP